MAKGPIEFIEDLTTKKTDWNDQSEADKKGYSPFMMNRWISMSQDWIEVVAETQRYTAVISPRINYLFYSDILPKKKFWFKYASSKTEKIKELSVLISLVSKKLFVSEKEASEYVDILIQTGRKQELSEWTKKFGFTEKELSKIFKL